MHSNLANTTHKGARGCARLFKWPALLLAIIAAFVLLLVVSPGKGGQPNALEVYLAEQARKPVVRQHLEQKFRRPFDRFSQEQYATFMKGLNFNHDEDLFRWSHVTDIPIIALRKTSSFFRKNLHLLEDNVAAEQLSRTTSYKYKTTYDEGTGMIEVRDESGVSLKLRTLPDDLLMPIDRVDRYWHYQNFADSEINYEVIGPYLLHFGELSYREALGEWIRKIPLNIVKVYRGKAIYVTNLPGRSFATTMPVSNTVYKLHIGLVTGVWIEMRSDGNKGTESNFIHEFGHVFDYAVLQGGYGSYRENHQFPEFRKLLTEKEKIFGVKDDKVPNTPFGYISNYAKTNSQESFAEHFRAFISEREQFRLKAETEAMQGHLELMLKYRFMETMMENTSAKTVRLSRVYLEKEAGVSRPR